MFLRALSLLAALLASTATAENPPAEPTVNGLRWSLQTQPQFTTFDGLQVNAQLQNGIAKPLQFTDEGHRQAIELILTAEGKKPVRKPLPASATVQAGGAKLTPAAFAFYVRCDLRRAFGPLAPGSYTVEIVYAARGYKTDVPGFQRKAVASKPHAFKIVKTTLQDAQKKNRKVKGLELKVETFKDRKVVVFTNKRNHSVTFWAYGQGGRQGPLSSLVMAQTWNGTQWQGGLGGFCGTGLEAFVLKPDESRELQLPLYSEGIGRLRMNCTTGQGEDATQFVVTSDAFVARSN